ERFTTKALGEGLEDRRQGREFEWDSPTPDPHVLTPTRSLRRNFNLPLVNRPTIRKIRSERIERSGEGVMGDLSHFDDRGASRMVDVSGKAVTLRTARASALVRMEPATLSLIGDRRLAKGDVFEVARLAGIMAAKRTGDLIPLCHPLGLDS